MRADREISEMDIIEREYMLKVWRQAQSFANDYNKERDFIYWDEMEEVLRGFASWFNHESELNYILSELEQKKHVLANKSQEVENEEQKERDEI